MASKRPIAPRPIENIPMPEPVVDTPAPQKGGQSSVTDAIRKALTIPKSSGSVPTLTCIEKGAYRRYFLLDVDGEAYRKAWDIYRKDVPHGSPEEFVEIVLRILSQDMPRMHRAVSYVPLV